MGRRRKNGFKTVLEQVGDMALAMKEEREQKAAQSTTARETTRRRKAVACASAEESAGVTCCTTVASPETQAALGEAAARVAAAPPSAEAIAGAVMAVPVDAIQETGFNPRKRFDEAALAELTASVRAKGILQPLVVRPSDQDLGKYEVVCGARRLRAARAAELTAVPCVVREDLDAAAALEIRVVENLQRQDVDPLEEADGFGQLVAAGRSAEAIAAKVGKAVSYVRTRLVLVDLPEQGRELLARGQIGIASAIAVARIRDPKAREAAVKSMRDQLRHDDDVLSRSDVEHVVAAHALVPLARAPFSPADAGLVERAGSCQTCPKCTTNDVDLFGDVAGEAACMDRACYLAKCAAHFARTVTPEAKEAGSRVVAAAASKKLFDRHAPYRDEKVRDLAYNAKLVDLDHATIYSYRGGHVPLAQVLGEVDPRKVTVTMDPDGKVRRLVSREMLLAAERSARARDRQKAKASSTPAERAADEKAKAKEKAELVRHAAIAASIPVIARAAAEAASLPGGFFDQLLHWVTVEALVRLDDGAGRRVLGRVGLKPPRPGYWRTQGKHVARAIQGLAREQVLGLLVEAVVMGDWDQSYSIAGLPHQLPDEIASLAEAAGVDAKRIIAVRVKDIAAQKRFSTATCAGCGCTERKACPGGCYWALVPDLVTKAGVCSRCVEQGAPVTLPAGSPPAGKRGGKGSAARPKA